MMYARTFLAQIPLRAAPSDTSEIVSFVLFGERFQVLEVQEKWAYIQLDNDGYQGWIDPKQYVKDTSKPAKQKYYTTQNFTRLIDKDSPRIAFDIPMGCELPCFQEGICKVGSYMYDVEGEASMAQDFDALQLCLKAETLLHTPYLWGGRSSWGIDCSGFTQLLFRLYGVDLLRDAQQQVTQGNEISLLKAEAGDLAFFHNPQQKIIHVGIILSKNKIIHASGCVRIDTLDEQGIFNEETESYSHHLCAIRRIR